MITLTNLRSFASRHRWKLLIALLVGVPVVFGIAALARSKEIEYVTGVAAKGDLLQTVEAVGTVTSERDIELKFAIAGIVSQVLVKEGDRVWPGQRLALLKAGTTPASIASAAAILQSEEARLRAMREGARPEDIAIAEAELLAKKASLEVARTSLLTAEANAAASERKLKSLTQETDINLAGNIAAGRSAVSEKLSSIRSSLREIDDVLADNAVQDAIIKSSPIGEQQVRDAQRTAEAAIVSAIAGGSGVDGYQDALDALSTARDAAHKGAVVLQQAYDLIATLPLTDYYTSTIRETHKATLSSARASALTGVTALENGLNTLRDASASYATRTAAEEASLSTALGARDRAKADILTFEAAVQLSEAQLNLKRAGTRSQDIQAQEARVRQARADVARAQASFADTVLVSPLEGTVTKVHIKPGEFTPAGPAITMLGTSPYRIEMFVSEVDVPKVALTQSGSIELDAFPDTHFKLRVSEIDPASTEVDGVAKYRIKLDFLYPHPELKIGMTGDATIVTGERMDVVSVPKRAIVQGEGSGSVVRLLDEEKEVTLVPVTTGMEGEAGDVEITSGLKGGETVILLEKES